MESNAEDENKDEKMDQDSGEFLERFTKDEDRNEEADQFRDSEDEVNNKRGNVEIETPTEKKNYSDVSVHDLLLSSDDEDDESEDTGSLVSTEKVMITDAVEKEDFLSPNEETAEFQEYLRDLSVDPADFKPLIGLLSIDFDNPESIPQFLEQFSHIGIWINKRSLKEAAVDLLKCPAKNDPPWLSSHQTGR